ncbi:MAG: DUF308 domain-containing protein [Solirubrobacteraceae bacterium]|nr:DUF308 domain-containing protein [Solirubrobacteraceae bacterium]
MSAAVAVEAVEPSPPKNLWWLLAILGALTILVGFAALVFPGPTLLAVGLLFGIWLVIWGAFSLYRGIAESGGTAVRVLSVIIGVLGVIVGLVLIVRPGQSVLTVVFVIGIWWVVTGILEFIQGVAVKEYRWTNLILGLIGAAAGIIILVWPGIGLVTLVFIVGFTLIFRGTLEVVLAFQLRKLGQEA